MGTPKLVYHEGYYDFVLMVESNAKPDDIAEAFGVTKSCVFRWKKMHREGTLQEYVENQQRRMGMAKDTILLAKTCIKCGLFLGAKWFIKDKRGYWDSYCRLCSSKVANASAAKRSPETRRRYAKKTNHRAAIKQKVTRANAFNHRKPWTHRHIKILAETSHLPVVDRAGILGRTQSATYNAIYRLQEGRRLGLPEDLSDQQWVIFFNRG